MRIRIAVVLALCLVLLSGCVIRVTPGGGKKTALVEGSETPEAFSSLVIQADVADVTIVYGDGWNVEYALPVEPEITVDNSTLTVRDLTKNMSINNVSPYIHVTVPQLTELETAEIHVDVGNVTAKGLSLKAMTVEVDIGNVDLDDLQLTDLTVTTDVGSVDLDRLMAQNTNITVDTGDIEAELLGEAELYTLDLLTNDGEVEVDDREQGTKFSAGDGEWQFTAHADVGEVDVEFLGGAISPRA